MVKKGPRYTPQEAEARIRLVAKRLALEAVDLVITLDRLPVNTHAVERRIWSLTGQAGYLARLANVIWRYEALKKAAAPQTA